LKQLNDLGAVENVKGNEHAAMTLIKSKLSLLICSFEKEGGINCFIDIWGNDADADSVFRFLD
jgi:hypothetical protein